MANPPIGQKQLITAEQFNELIAEYHTYWADDNTSYAFNDLAVLTKNSHSKGWGQASVEVPVTPTTTIEALHLNKLIAQLNAGLYHIDESNTLCSSFKLAGNKIPAAAYVTVDSFISSIENTRFNTTTADIVVDILDGAVQVEHDNPMENWDDYAYAKVKATFTNYAEARYFFNSGGSIIFDISGIGGNPRGGGWSQSLNYIGEVWVGAISTTNTGASIPSVNKGIFDAFSGVDTELYSVKISQTNYTGGGGEYGGEYGYSEYGQPDYSGGEYDACTLKINLLSSEIAPGGVFEMLFTVILDEEDIGTNTVDIALDLVTGYRLPMETPTDIDLAASPTFESKFSADTTTYQFQDRVAPVLGINTVWTLVNH